MLLEWLLLLPHLLQPWRTGPMRNQIHWHFSADHLFFFSPCTLKNTVTNMAIWIVAEEEQTTGLLLFMSCTCVRIYTATRFHHRGVCEKTWHWYSLELRVIVLNTFPALKKKKKTAMVCSGYHSCHSAAWSVYQWWVCSAASALKRVLRI